MVPEYFVRYGCISRVIKMAADNRVTIRESAICPTVVLLSIVILKCLLSVSEMQHLMRICNTAADAFLTRIIFAINSPKMENVLLY